MDLKPISPTLLWYAIVNLRTDADGNKVTTAAHLARIIGRRRRATRMNSRPL